MTEGAMTKSDQSLATKLRGDYVLVTAWSAIPDPQVADILARCPYDAVTLDMQHGQQTFESVITGTAAIRAAGKHAIVRIPVGDFATASRALDAGVEAVIAPMINSEDDARAFAASVKYPPVGERSWGPLRAMSILDMDGQTYLEKANETCLAIAMIETPQAIKNIDAIMAVDGIDGVLVGPGDLSLTLSKGAKIDPSGKQAQAAVKKIATKAKAAGKSCTIFVVSIKDAHSAKKMGANMLCLGVDAMLMQAGAHALLSEFRGK